MANLRIQSRRNRAPTRRPARPITAHVSWRLKMLYGLLPFADSTVAEADSTMTSPSSTKTTTTTAIT